MKSITIGNGVTSIGDYTFYRCEELESVYCKAKTPPTLESSIFGENPLDPKIYVPTASVDAYKAAEGWKNYADNIIGYEF
ncbi:MAG: hypothetical protein IJ288_03205 [Alistipes sp.]|nr:hypothetical protein [Alistipes sp.]